MSGSDSPPAKKKREHPNKKWRESEVLLIIEFLQKETEFESPTAQIYYRRFLKKSQLDATWDLVRWKVRHLKAQYRKANDWLASTGAGQLEQGDSRAIAKIAKICPHFDKLEEIFGKRVPGRQPLLLKPNVSIVNEQLPVVREQKITLEERRLQLEEKKYEWDREMEEKKLELEVKKLEMEDRWKVLALEMKERIAKYEIDKKYSNKN